MAKKEKKPVNTGKILRDPATNQLLPGTASLNPNGRPKGSKNMSTLLWEALQKKAKKKDGTDSDTTHAEMIVARLVKDAIEKGSRIEMIFDRIDGQAKQEIDFTSNGETVQTGSIDVDAIARRVAEDLKKQKTKK